MKYYLAVVPLKNGNNYNYHMENLGSYGNLEICQEAVNASGLTTSRKNPQKIGVQLFRLDIVNHKLEKVSLGGWAVQPPVVPLTEEEFGEELTEILGDFPEEFRNYVRKQVYVHESDGYEAMVAIASEIAEELLPCVQNYTKKLKLTWNS